MKINRIAPLTRAENSIISASIAEEHRSSFIGGKISTGPPAARFNLIDQEEFGFETRSEQLRTAARAHETTIVPRRRGGWRPLLYWFVAFAAIAAPVPAAS